MEKEAYGIQITGYGGIGISDEKSKMLEDYIDRKQNIQKKDLAIVLAESEDSFDYYVETTAGRIECMDVFDKEVTVIKQFENGKKKYCITVQNRIDINVINVVMAFLNEDSVEQCDSAMAKANLLGLCVSDKEK